MVPRRINVLDMFNGDGRSKMPDFKALKNAGLIAVIHMATEGTFYTDPYYSERRKAAQDAGLLWGAYHYLDHSDAVSQADHFLEKSEIHSESGFGSIAAACNYSRSERAGSLHQCYRLMAELDGERGVSSILYSADLIRETLRPHVAGHQSTAMVGVEQFFRKHRLWLAEYGPTSAIPWPWETRAADKTIDHELSPGVWLWKYASLGRIDPIIGNTNGYFYDGTPEQLAATWVSG